MFFDIYAIRGWNCYRFFFLNQSTDSNSRFDYYYIPDSKLDSLFPYWILWRNVYWPNKLKKKTWAATRGYSFSLISFLIKELLYFNIYILFVNRKNLYKWTKRLITYIASINCTKQNAIKCTEDSPKLFVIMGGNWSASNE